MSLRPRAAEIEREGEGRRVRARRAELEGRALFRLTLSYLSVFAVVVAVLSVVAYLAVEANYRSIVAPALDTPEGRAGFAAALRPALFAILSSDAFLLLAVGLASYFLARSALRPLGLAREREERFAGDIAHELRTPLGAIASLAQAAAPRADGAARTALDAIARRALEGGNLVADLLTLAQHDEATALLECEPVDLAAIAQSACRDLSFEPDGLVLDGTFSSAVVTGDERRLRQLVRNLVENARQHARTRIAVSVFATGGMAHLCVEDDGAGVAPEVAPRLFERFSKGADSKGAGLGLAISRWVARTHGGELAYAGGSRFVATLPLTRD